MMKPTILLITSNYSLFQAFASSLPDIFHCKMVSSEMGLPQDNDPLQFEEILVVVLDTAFPNSGALYPALQNHPNLSHLPVIAILHDAENREEVLELGASDYLFYPFVLQEVNIRLSAIFPQSAFLDLLINAIADVQNGISLLQTICDHLDEMATAVFAQEVHLCLYLPSTNALRHIAPEGMTLPTEVREYLLTYLAQSDIPLLTTFDGLAKFTNSHLWAMSVLSREQEPQGILLFKYEREPLWTNVQRRLFVKFSNLLGQLLTLSHLQQESQSYATQTAFMVLVAKMLAEQSDLSRMLSMTLEHILSLLNASGGEIWLKSPNEQTLELASSLTTSFSSPSQQTIEATSGLIGHVFTHRESQQIDLRAPNMEIMSEHDQMYQGNCRFLLAASLFHQEKIGVILIYHKRQEPFSGADIMLLEGIAGLLASAIANAQLVAELRDYGEQKNVLYEMSQQIASGLDLTTTFNRTLGWATRLCHVEVGLLWLVDDGYQNLQLAATHGLNDPLPPEPVILQFDQCFIGLAASQGKVVVSNEPHNNPQYERTLEAKLHLSMRNILVVPMVYHQDVIGALSLLNKVGEAFTEMDSTLLTTAGDMIATAIGNARLHSQTVSLMQERERLHQQAIQSERLATVGRLTASMAHEINNPMQAIKGSMMLALEELDDPEALQEYIDLSIEQADRVVNLVSRMRDIYRPTTNKAESVQLNQILQDVLAVSNKEMQRQNVRMRPELAENVPEIVAVSNQLHLVFLNIILNMSESIGKHGGGTMHVKTAVSASHISVEFATAVSHLPIASLLQILQGETPEETGFSLSFSHDIVTAYGGTLQLFAQDELAVLQIELPIQ